jgi:hypothetical protein
LEASGAKLIPKILKEHKKIMHSWWALSSPSMNFQGYNKSFNVS